MDDKIVDEEINKCLLAISVRAIFAIRNVSENREWRYRQRSNGLTHVSVASRLRRTAFFDELYNFHSEIVRMLGCIEHIEYLQALRDRNLSNHLQ